jgi:hypothetical protein
MKKIKLALFFYCSASTIAFGMQDMDVETGNIVIVKQEHNNENSARFLLSPAETNELKTIIVEMRKQKLRIKYFKTSPTRRNSQ